MIEKHSDQGEMSYYQEVDEEERGPNVLLLSNPKAGRGSKYRLINELTQSLSETGLVPQVVDSLEALSVESAHLADQLRCAVAIGGDGTVRAVANAVSNGSDRKIPIAVVPMGTENLLARKFGHSADVSAVTAAIKECKTCRIDAGRVGGKLFLIMFSCGFDAEVIDRLHRSRTGNISHFSYAKPIFDALFGYRFPRMRLIAENSTTGTEETLDSHWVFAFNLPNYARGIPIAPQADPNDGQFDVCSFQGGSRTAAFFHFATALVGMHGQWSGCRRQRYTRIRIEADEPVPYQVDGDQGGVLPVELEMLPNHVSIVLPASNFK